MFGKEPRLPVDFLLGRTREPAASNIHDWVLEHQTRLHVAFEGAQEQLQVAADCRKARYDLHISEVPLEEGQLVYLCQFGVRGHS